jgi:hypothetical protein
MYTEICKDLGIRKLKLTKNGKWAVQLRMLEQVGKEGFVEVQRRPVKANDFVMILLLSLDPVHVLYSLSSFKKIPSPVVGPLKIP